MDIIEREVDNYLDKLFIGIPNNTKTIEIRSNLRSTIINNISSSIEEGMETKTAIEDALLSIKEEEYKVKDLNTRSDRRNYDDTVFEYKALLEEHYNKFKGLRKKCTLKMCIGVALIIHAFSGAYLFDDSIFMERLFILYFGIFLSIGVAFIILSNLEARGYDFIHPYSLIELRDLEKSPIINQLKMDINKEVEEHSKKYYIYLVSGVTLCIISFFILMALEGMLGDLGSFIYFQITAVGVALIIYYAKMRNTPYYLKRGR